VTYKIERHHFRTDIPTKVIATGLTLKEAQKHCKNPETSSSTCKKPENIEYTAKNGMWFDGYEEE